MTKEKRSDLINRPDKWTANTEIDFGGGLYGYRATGTFTANANSDKNIQLYAANATTIVSYGGYWTRGGYVLPMPIAETIAANKSQAYIYLGAGKDIRCSTLSSEARTDAPYDIWVLYTK